MQCQCVQLPVWWGGAVQIVAELWLKSATDNERATSALHTEAEKADEMRISGACLGFETYTLDSCAT